MSITLLTADTTAFTADSTVLTADMTQLVRLAPGQSIRPLALLRQWQQQWSIQGAGGMIVNAVFGRPVVGGGITLTGIDGGAQGGAQFGAVTLRRGAIMSEEEDLLLLAA